MTSLSTEAPPGERDNFERVAAEVLADPALQAADPGGSVASAAPVGGPAPAAVPPVPPGLAGLTPAGVEQWLSVLPNAFAGWFKDESFKLQPYELEVARQPAFDLAQRHLPEVLKKSNSPEWAIISAVFLGYGLRVGIPLWQKIQAARQQSNSTAPVPAKSEVAYLDQVISGLKNPVEAQPAPAPATLQPLTVKPPSNGPFVLPVPGRGASMPL